MEKGFPIRSAFTLMEVLISMTILAVLMTAVAVAFDASMKNYKDNEALAKQMNIARAALLRMTNDIRTAREIVVNADSTQCRIASNGDDQPDIIYRFDGNVLYLDVCSSSGPPIHYVLCENIAEMTFTWSPVPGQPSLVRNVRITMTVTDESSQTSKKLAAAAVVRRNL